MALHYAVGFRTKAYVKTIVIERAYKEMHTAQQGTHAPSHMIVIAIVLLMCIVKRKSRTQTHAIRLHMPYSKPTE